MRSRVEYEILFSTILVALKTIFPCISLRLEMFAFMVTPANSFHLYDVQSKQAASEVYFDHKRIVFTVSTVEISLHINK